MSTTLLVDGNAVAYTINLDDCYDEKDFARRFFSRLREYSKQFTSMVKCVLFFDDKNGTWRDKIYPDYQKDRRAQREKYTEAQRDEANKRTSYLIYLESLIDKSKFDRISYPHTETDDMIALYCKNIQEDGENCVILTTDKDLFQLICDSGKKKVHVLFLIKRKLIKDEKEGKDILERKIMLGDPSDSIPSVCQGVGPKYYPDFKLFLKTVKENKVDPTNKEEAKKICESLGVKYINSFSNFNQEQLIVNNLLVNLDTVVENDEKDGNTKTKFIRDRLKTAKISPYSLYNIKVD